MRVENGVDVVDVFADRLLAKIRGGVDDDVLVVISDHDGRTRAAVHRILGMTHGTRAPQRRHAHGRTASEYRERGFHFFVKGLGMAPGGAGCTLRVRALVTST